MVGWRKIKKSICRTQRNQKKKVGRPTTLTEEHQRFLEEKFVDEPSATIDQAMESPTG
ncbi:hypothetical protein BDF21DRAFT_412996 [Thamnidium elegans]|nr:hypothetical protein BDF21DRAFT_412996 [Thamnidium elegans]